MTTETIHARCGKPESGCACYEGAEYQAQFKDAKAGFIFVHLHKCSECGDETECDNYDCLTPEQFDAAVFQGECLEESIEDESTCSECEEIAQDEHDADIRFLNREYMRNAL